MATSYRVCQPSSLPVDPLCCHEEDLFPFWEEEVAPDQCGGDRQPAAAEEEVSGNVLWDWVEDGGGEEGVELASLLSKEVEAHFAAKLFADAEPCASWVRLDAVGWLLKACARHGFNPQTALLAVDYLDRFLASPRCCGGPQQQQQPWMAQLLAVACLSLAAKMEETHVPLLLDLQVEEARYVFEARTVRRMELLVLSTLGWRMGAPTPFSFIDHFLRRRSAAADNDAHQLQRGYAHLHWKFQARCHSIILALAADSRWVQFLPSVLAAATMLHALAQLLDQHPTAMSTMNLQNSLTNLLNVTKDQMQACTEFILDITANGGDGRGGRAARNKRKHLHISPPSLPPPSSPRGILDASFRYDSCGDSRPTSASTSVLSSPNMSPHRAFKRLRSMAAADGDGPRPLLDGVFV